MKTLKQTPEKDKDKESSSIVRILQPSIDDVGPYTVLRGLVDRESLQNLRSDFYQREKMSTYSRRDIIFALENNVQLPDIELGLRGEKFDLEPNGSLILSDPVYIIDGRQRVESLLDFLASTPDSNAHIGAIIHVNTSVDWERDRFHKLNTSRVKVSPSVLLKNLKEEVSLIATLYGLSTNDPTFALHNRISWQQNSARGELVTASSYLKTALRLHSHLTASRAINGVENIVNTARRVQERIGISTVRQNTFYFWSLIDDLWGISNHKLRYGIPYLNTTFLQTLTDVLSDHVDFWVHPTDTRLAVPYDLKAKLKKFPVYDPEVVRLSGSAGQAGQTLYFLFLQHINSGKRTKRLIERNAKITLLPTEDDPKDDPET